MKKLWLLLLFLIIIGLACIYIFIPSKITIVKVVNISCNINSTQRFLTSNTGWHKWFPTGRENEKTKTDNIYKYKNNSFIIPKFSSNGIPVLINHNEKLFKGVINIIPLLKDNVAIQWESEMPRTINPIAMLRNYANAKKLYNDMGDILKSLKSFLEKSENIYGISIKEIKVTDTLLVATKFNTREYPQLLTVYNEIDSLNKYAALNGATQNSYPMMHINKINERYETMVAIPINKPVAETNDFFLRRMVPGKILVTEIKGGDSSVGKAYRQMDTYMLDNERTGMALPFQSLVTDRRKEKDSSKWITKIFYPVM